MAMLSGCASSYQEPDHQTVKQTQSYEIRYYQERLVAEVKENSGNSGFRMLFGYISGDNDIQQEMAMTVPVAQSLSAENPNMQFFLPKSYTLASAPMPTNSKVELKLLPSGYFAVITYSGFASDGNFYKHASKLRTALEKDGIKTLGEPIKATYNSPFTLPFKRRNEVWTPILMDED